MILLSYLTISTIKVAIPLTQWLHVACETLFCCLQSQKIKMFKERKQRRMLPTVNYLHGTVFQGFLCFTCW